MEKEERFFIQVIKYGLVGALNTVLTAVVIYLILHLRWNSDNYNQPSASLMISANITGYVAGIINSFVLNRNWTFKSRRRWRDSFIRFLIAFGICYTIQLGVVLWLSRLDISLEWQVGSVVMTWAYVCQLTGIIIYSLLNFLLNKYYTFKVDVERCGSLVK